MNFNVGGDIFGAKLCLLVPQYHIMLDNYSALQALLLCLSKRPESSYLEENGIPGNNDHGFPTCMVHTLKDQSVIEACCFCFCIINRMK